ncbi:SGNH/GDSL hydrolase family protein [Streptomyces sp. CA-249302]|uniref:SGNH/GDSL hydrolase family protein n=1 Tax=Streptomyces sp. CA-249302 TaxID=3240058 RepID=UPI003D93BC32
MPYASNPFLLGCPAALSPGRATCRVHRIAAPDTSETEEQDLTMKNSVRAGLAGLLAFGVLGTVVGIAHHDDDSDGPAPKGPYVAMGDSYTAGPEIPDQKGEPAGCDRSDRNYPSLVARRLGLKSADFQDVSCTGATIGNLTDVQGTDDGANQAQLSALSDETRLVTLGIGGNDIGFSSMIKQCVKQGVVYYALGGGSRADDGDADAPCRERYVSGGTDEVQEKIKAADEQLARALGEVRQRAPEARVYVVGYPAILPAESSGCGRAMGLAPGDVSYLHEKEQQLNAMLRARAKTAGVRYVDTYTPSVGRDACSTRGERWIEPLIPRAAAAAVHPNERGERGMADAVLKTLGTGD